MKARKDGGPHAICRDLSELSAALRPAAREFFRRLSAAVVPMGLRCGPAETRRSLERQMYLHTLNDPARRLWYTDCDGVVNVSRHQSGDAFDYWIAGPDKKYVNVKHPAWKIAAQIARDLGLKTISKEAGHVELPD